MKHEVSDKSHPSLELAFLNSGYLSELWAVQDLLKVKNAHPDQWTNKREIQLQDEVRHARILLDQLKKAQSPIVCDLKFSMQERLYKPFVDLSKTQTIEESAAVHDLTERRATWIYKTFLRLSQNQEFIAVCKQIMNDEKNHFEVNASVQCSPVLRSSLNGIDRFLFRKHLPEKYGRIMLLSQKFWSDYYDGAIFLKEDQCPLNTEIAS
jgi:hypothetical protein